MVYMAAGKTVKIACYGDDSTTDGLNTTGWVINVTNTDGGAAGQNHNATAPRSWTVRMGGCWLICITTATSKYSMPVILEKNG